jgi:4-aminobutyrate--pyruvate transaminase
MLQSRCRRSLRAPQGDRSPAHSTRFPRLLRLGGQRHAGEPGRPLILARDCACRISTVFAAGLTGLPALHEAFGLPQPDSVVRLRAPWPRHEAHDGEDEHAFVDRLADELEDAIVAAGPGRVAVFIA